MGATSQNRHSIGGKKAKSVIDRIKPRFAVLTLHIDRGRCTNIVKRIKLGSKQNFGKFTQFFFSRQF
jgi:hypothetical protein